jgi:hypothetical protein
MSDSADKLARTRLAIIEHVHRKERKRRGQEPDPVATRQAHPQQHASAQQMGRASDEPYRSEMPMPDQAEGWAAHALHAVRTWWRYHPAHMVVDIATPALSSYARRKPVQYLGIAAAVGAVFLLARPWKLISVTGLVVALLKSSQVSALLMSAMSSSQNPKDDPPV